MSDEDSQVSLVSTGHSNLGSLFFVKLLGDDRAEGRLNPYPEFRPYS